MPHTTICISFLKFSLYSVLFLNYLFFLNLFTINNCYTYLHNFCFIYIYNKCFYLFLFVYTGKDNNIYIFFLYLYLFYIFNILHVGTVHILTIFFNIISFLINIKKELSVYYFLGVLFFKSLVFPSPYCFNIFVIINMIFKSGKLKN